MAALRPEALEGALAKGVPPVSWIHGNEPFLVLEAADRVRVAAREAGYDERIVLHVERSFQPDAIRNEVDSLSLFASRRLIDVRVPARPGKELIQTIGALCEQGMPDDVRLLVSSERPDSAGLRSADFKRIEQRGMTVALYPIERARLPQWLAQRLRRQGQQADTPLLELIAERVEGNLLAADQEVRKLGLLFPEGRLPLEETSAAVLEVARYEGQDLVDAVLAGDPARALRSIDGLSAEGRAETLVVWHLADCARALLRLLEARDAGEPLKAVFPTIRAFGPRQALFESALRRAHRDTVEQALTTLARADTMSKGLLAGDCWQLIRQVALRLSGGPSLREPA